MPSPSTDPSPADPVDLSHAMIASRLRAVGCVYAEDEAELLIGAANFPAELADLVDRRVDGIPLEQLLGWAEFAGLRIEVAEGVFVPRRRTEFLVRQAVDLAFPGAVVVDLCCGSGAVGAALAAALDQIELYAADIDPAAIWCARRNLEPVGGHILAGDLFDPLPAELRGRIDIVAANAPYVPTESIEMMPQEARLYEPDISLNGGPDGLDIQRRIAADAPHWLAPGGHLLIETSKLQAPETVAIFERNGLDATLVSSDEYDASVVIGML